MHQLCMKINQRRKKTTRMSFRHPKRSLVYSSVKRRGEDKEVIISLCCCVLTIGPVNFSEYNNLKMAKDQEIFQVPRGLGVD